jgi:hypothetical protein
MEVASAFAIGTFAFVKNPAALCAMLALLIGSVFSGCASSHEEGVVTESTEQRTTSADAHFARPSYNAGDTGGMNSGHPGIIGF